MELEQTVFSDIATALKHPQQVKVLELVGDDFQLTNLHLPEELGKLRNLESLSIEDYRYIHNLDKIASLSNLKKLDLECYNEEAFPSAILKLHNLQHLCVHMTEGNRCALPGDIHKLKQLKSLTIEGVAFGNEIACLKSLESLSIVLRSMTGFPCDLRKLKRLTYLDLDYCGLKYLPKEICYLKKLEYLNISHTYIDELPLEIANLKSLKTLLFTKPFLISIIPKPVSRATQAWAEFATKHKSTESLWLSDHIVD